MAGPAGALAGTFKIVRGLQVVSLIAIIGMAANFISDMVSNNNAPSDVLVGTLSIVRNYHSWKISSCADHRSTDMYRGPLLCNHDNPVH